MILLDFIERMKPLGIFSLADIEVLYPNLDKRRLFEWKEKGYIIKLRSRWYCLPVFLKEQYSNWIIANLIHPPAYISLETALNYYGVIPEGVFMTSSVTTNRSFRIELLGHNYSYSSAKQDLYFGYQLMDIAESDRKVRIADLEKSIIDFFYFRPGFRTIKDISGLRFNEPVLRDSLNRERLNQYLEKIRNKELEVRVGKMLKMYTDA